MQTSLPEVFDNLVLNLVSVLFEETSMDPAKNENVEGDHDVVICIPWFCTQLFLVNQSVLHSERNIRVEFVIVMGILVVVINEFALLLLVSLSNVRSHINDFIDIQSGTKEIL